MSRYIKDIRISPVGLLRPVGTCNYLNDDNCKIVSFVSYNVDGNFFVNVKGEESELNGNFHIEAQSKEVIPVVLSLYERESDFIGKTRSEFCEMLDSILN